MIGKLSMSDFVSVVIPTYNEEKYIKHCVESLLLQDYPAECLEYIFVDGMSKDATREILDMYVKRYPNLIRVLDNPNKIVPYAMNIGISSAKGKYIVRMDAHADYATDYITKCVQCLENTGAENVGGVADTKANGFVGNAIAKMLSSKFGVGNSQFRTNGADGYVDTVPFGAFRREVFGKYGGYDTRLVRNQDNEMNYRIRKNGGKIYLSRSIHLSYYCRDTISGICSMGYKNGTWNVITMKLCPGSMGWRHFVPFLFVVSIIGLTLLGFINRMFWWLLLAEVSLYMVLDTLFAIKSGNSSKEKMLLFTLFPSFHISYGIGSLKGLLMLCKKEYRHCNYINKLI